jgi:hypothetical protein
MGKSLSSEERTRLEAEIETLHRWHKELNEFLTSGLNDAEVAQDEFSNAATMATRVIIRLKALYSQAARA